ncbi:hypothetical protein E8D34_03110 [Nocardioides sp. GY 10113]|uniref:hypothetical protein n=1 Tax=Nocardioides sp. GY 10113 TaxID=2569761 RepID=UPI0010A92D7E|nr:hypothetical protein [Nocardioides sp. GY 10113]TIC88678.1 hypothetical protein E8D34_03110 [Nocardioides sp. GY 10113]
MTERDGSRGSSSGNAEDDRRRDRPDAEEVGSVAEEAAKLFGAFADLAREHGAGGLGEGLGEGLGAMAGQAASFAREVNDHLATDAAECRYCPVCRAVHVVRETSPEVRAHLASAASSLLQAAAGLLDQAVSSAGEGSGDPHPRGPEVERIDLGDGSESGGEW